MYKILLNSRKHINISTAAKLLLFCNQEKKKKGKKKPKLKKKEKKSKYVVNQQKYGKYGLLMESDIYSKQQEFYL